ncbi:hypothetical protein BDR07DRAFT_1478486 [Suillus spraguei]|nr:hypothetical protein BDR07DRAFT_1478486 [Suillus spraguei]
MASNSPPILEEDLTHARLWSEDYDDQRNSQDISPPRSSSSTEKGKAKQLDEDDTIENPSSESYPPTNDEAAETRRVEEGLGDHRALQSRDSIDVVRLDDIDIDQSPTTANPFIHPSETESGLVSPALSPFVDTRERSGVMPRTFGSSSNRHSLQPATLPPPPQPLGLPPPLTPPPKGTRPRAIPMKSTPPPRLHQEPTEPEQEVRWWHDWLCGCSEGPDRGGDNQAGRTNPFE